MFIDDALVFGFLDFFLVSVVFGFNLGFFLNFLGRYLNKRGVKRLNLNEDV